MARFGPLKSKKGTCVHRLPFAFVSHSTCFQVSNGPVRTWESRESTRSSQRWWSEPPRTRSTDVTRRWLMTQPTPSHANPLLLSMIKSLPYSVKAFVWLWIVWTGTIRTSPDDICLPDKGAARIDVAAKNPSAGGKTAAWADKYSDTDAGRRRHDLQQI